MRRAAAVVVCALVSTPGCAAPPVAVSKGAAVEVGDGRAGWDREAAARADADLIAQEAVGARVTMLLHLDRLRGFQFSQRLMALGGWAEALEGTEVDPFVDVRRAFVAARAAHAGDVAVVLQHTAREERVTRSIRMLQRRWRAAPAKLEAGSLEARFPDPARLPFPAAYRESRGGPSPGSRVMLVTAPRPGLVAVLPPEQVLAAFRLMEVGSLPGPRGDEAVELRAWDPGSSVASGPVWSSDVRYADVVLSFDGAGNSTLAFRAVCASAEAAQAEAARLTAQVEEAQTLSFGGARMRLFDQVRFRAERDRIEMRARLPANDVRWIVAMTTRPL